MKKKKFIIIILCCVIFLTLFYYIFFGHKIRKNFSELKNEMYISDVLASKVGKIKNVFFDNYINWYDIYKGENCIKFNIYNNKYKKTDVCTLGWIYNDVYNNKSELKAIGYIINDNMVVYDIPPFDLLGYSEKIDNFQIIETNKKVDDYIELKSLCKQYLSLNDKYDESFYYDSSENGWLYVASLYNFDTNLYRIDYYKNIYIIVNSNGQILANWEENLN